MIILNPIFALIIVFIAYISRILRFLFDRIFYFMIKCCGNVPEVDTCFARRIRGPGISRDLFTSLDPEDIQVLLNI